MKKIKKKSSHQNSLSVSQGEGDDFSPPKDQLKDRLDGNAKTGIMPLLDKQKK